MGLPSVSPTSTFLFRVPKNPGGRILENVFKVREKNNIYYGEKEHTNIFTIFGGIIMFIICTVIFVAALFAYAIAISHFDGENDLYIDEETGNVYTRNELSNTYAKENWNDIVKFYNTHINTMEKS